MAQTERVEIQNVVASADLGIELDLESLSIDLSGADYQPSNFPGLVYRTQDPKAATLIFRSGKVVTTGASSSEAVHEALDLVAQELRDLGVDIDSDLDAEVVNIVSNVDIGYSLNLNAVAIGLGLEDVEYEPEQFPGLVYRMDEPDVVALLFGSGEAVVTGGTEKEQASTAVKHIREELDELGLAG